MVSARMAASHWILHILRPRDLSPTCDCVISSGKDIPISNHSSMSLLIPQPLGNESALFERRFPLKVTSETFASLLGHDRTASNHRKDRST